MICIWCRQDFDKLSLEHAIPEGLACPPELELNNVACTDCNTSLGRVDRALLKQFEAVTVMYGVPRKKGRPPKIRSWRGVRSEHRADGPHIYMNAGPDIVDADGVPLHPASKATGITNVWVKPETAEMGFSQQFGNDPRFLPALFKIGLNMVARDFGPEVAAGSAYDHIRAFVREERGSPALTVAMSRRLTPQPVTAVVGGGRPDRPYPVYEVTLLGVSFLIDLAPDQISLRDLRGAMMLHGDPLYIFPFRAAA